MCNHFLYFGFYKRVEGAIFDLGSINIKVVVVVPFGEQAISLLMNSKGKDIDQCRTNI